MTGLAPVVVATLNRGKLDEFARLLDGAFRLEPLPDEVVLPEESGLTFAENARLKAKAVFNALGGVVAVLADDSGLEVAALGGRPGVLSARYAGERARDEDNVKKLLAELEGRADREARFVCALCLVMRRKGTGSEGGPRVIEVEGVIEGTIAESPHGERGFGYDPIFRPRGRRETLAEVPAAAKDDMSHRGAAVRALLARISTEADDVSATRSARHGS